MKVLVTALALGLMSAGASFAHATRALDGEAAMPIMTVDKAGFLTQVGSSNLFEIESSRLAEQKADADDVKAFATQMIADHTKAAEAAQAAAPDAAPPMLAPKHAAQIEFLKTAEGSDFTMLYIDMQAGAHMAAVALFQTYAGDPDDEMVGAFAKKTLPTLEMHNMQVKQLVAVR